MNKLFGTDGIRGKADKFPLDFSSVYTLGKALALLLMEKGGSPKIIIGRDTRESGPNLEQALIQGIEDVQGEALSAGVIPTSAISYLTSNFDFSAGVVISASHNPYEDNGIKIFSSSGMKIPQKWERKLEKAILSNTKEIKEIDRDIIPESSLSRKYSEFIKNKFSFGKINNNFKLVLDCSNGAASFFAPGIFSDLGFDVITLNGKPDGKNINLNCGSLHPQDLAKAVIERNAAMGIAYDGDADRALWVDEKGRLLNGDHTLYVMAGHMQEKGTLRSKCIVATPMSNMGLEKSLKKRGIELVRAPVGDRFVLEEMLKFKSNLGGEQSGHTIFLDDCPTGDGILTSIKMLEVMLNKEAPLSQLVNEFEEFPQVLLNVDVSKKEDFSAYSEIKNTMDRIKKSLGSKGRLNVRYSGTESVARIMIEGEDRKKISEMADQLAQVITKYLR